MAKIYFAGCSPSRSWQLSYALALAAQSRLWSRTSAETASGQTQMFRQVVPHRSSNPARLGARNQEFDQINIPRIASQDPEQIHSPRITGATLGSTITHLLSTASPRGSFYYCEVEMHIVRVQGCPGHFSERISAQLVVRLTSFWNMGPASATLRPSTLNSARLS